MAAGDTYELRVIGQILSQTHIHTLHVRQLGVGGDAAQVITEYQAGALAAYKGCFSIDDPVVQMIRAQKVCGALPLPAAVEVPIAPGAGQVGSRSTNPDRSPTFMAGLVSEKTALAGKSRRGRFFLGGLRDVDTSMNDMAAAWITLATAYCTALTATWITPGANGFQLVVHSRTLAAVPGTDCLASSTPVTSFVVSARPTTMRSRKLGHGN